MIRLRRAAALLAAAAFLAACGGSPPPAVAPIPAESGSPTGFISPARDVASDLEARNDALEK